MNSFRTGGTLLLSVCVTGCLIVAVSRLSAETTADPCAMPAELSAAVATEYPQSHVEGLADLTDGHQKRFRTEEGARCPGLLPLDFYGDNKQTLALILVAPEKVDLVVAHQAGSGWEIKSLESFDRSLPVQPPSAVIGMVQPGKYHDAYEKKTLRAVHPAILFGEYDAFVFLYAWTGRQVEKVCLHD